MTRLRTAALALTATALTALTLTGCSDGGVSINVDIKPTPSVSVNAAADAKTLAVEACNGLKTFNDSGDPDATTVAKDNAAAAARKDATYKALATQTADFHTQYWPAFNSDSEDALKDAEALVKAFEHMEKASKSCKDLGVNINYTPMGQYDDVAPG